MIKGIIFDMDGTLIDSMSYWVNSGMPLIKELILPKYPDFLNRDIAFIDIPKLIRKEIKEKDILEEIIYRWNFVEMKKNYEIIELKPFVKEFLDDCKSKGIKMCVATATTHLLAIPFLKRIGIYDYFDEVVTKDMGYRNKNYPDIYEHCLNTMGLDKSEVLVFEDTIDACRTLHDNNFISVGVKDYESRSYEDEIKSLVTYYIESYKGIKISDFE